MEFYDNHGPMVTIAYLYALTGLTFFAPLSALSYIYAFSCLATAACAFAAACFHTCSTHDDVKDSTTSVIL